MDTQFKSHFSSVLTMFPTSKRDDLRKTPIPGMRSPPLTCWTQGSKVGNEPNASSLRTNFHRTISRLIFQKRVATSSPMQL